MIRKKLSFILFTGIILYTSACCNIKEQKNTSEQSKYLLTATLYNYYASEYIALAFQAFNVAEERLSKIRIEHPDDKNLAVV